MDTFSIEFLMDKISLLERVVAQKDSVIIEKESVILTNSTVIAEKEAAIKKLEETIAANNIDLDAAKFQLEQLKRMVYGSKRERFATKLDAVQGSFEFEPHTNEIAEAVKEELELVRTEIVRRKPAKKHQGRVVLPSHLPVVETIIEPVEDTTGMVCIGHEITEELDYTPATLRINRIIRPKYITKEDIKGNQKQVIAKLDRPIPKCIASVGLLTWIFVDKFIYHMPLYRTLKRITSLGVPLANSTLESWVKLGSDLLRPLYAVHRKYIFSEIYQMIDESPIKVQDKDKPGVCHTGYMWVRYAPLSKSVLFEYYNSRSTAGPINDLHTFTGYIQTDGYSGYTHLAAVRDITHLSCWAHARRYFDKALSNDKKRAEHVLRLIQLLYAIEALAREKNMTHDERHALRLEKALPIINEIGAYIYAEKNKVLPHSPIGKAFDYCANRWISLQNYMKNGMLEIDSNMVENSIRPLALGRKNYLFAGSHEGAKNIAMFYGLFATCIKNDVDPQKWLTYVFNNIRKTEPENYKHLLPQFIDKELLG